MHQWIQSGGTEHLRSNLKDLHESSCFSIEGLAGVIVPKIGALAGTPFADLLFTYGSAKVLKTTRGLFLEKDLCQLLNLDKVEETLGITLSIADRAMIQRIFEINFVDDGVWPIFSPAADLINKARQAITILDKVCCAFGLVVNYKKGKTMVMVKFAGRGSAQYKRAFFEQDQGQIRFTGWLGDAKQCEKALLSTKTYKHMGSMADIGGSQMPDIVCRIGAMRGARKSIWTRVIRNELIPMKNRLAIVLIYLISKGFYNAATWHRFTVAEARRVHQGLMAIYRGLLRLDCPKCEHKTDNEVIRELECLSPLSTVVFLRVALFSRLVRKNNLTVLALLACAYDAKHSWLSTICRDLNKLADASPKLHELRNKDLSVWVACIKEHPVLFMKTIYDALSLPEVNEVKFWMPEGRDKNEQHDGPTFTFCCPHCPYVCSTPQANSWHLFDKHGIRHPVRGCIHSTVCECCLRDFHSREGVFTHISASSKICGLF